MKGKDHAWHIDRLRFYAERRWSMTATARVLRIDPKTIKVWATKYDVDFSGYDRATAKQRSIWFAMKPMRRSMVLLGSLGARELKNNPPGVSGELVQNIIEWQWRQWQGLARKRLWLKLRFASGRHTCYNAKGSRRACVFSPNCKERIRR